MLQRTPNPQLEVEEVGDVTLARLLGRNVVEEQTVRDVGRDLAGLLDRSNKPRLLVDFGAVEHLSSQAVAVLQRLHSQAGQAGGRLAVCGLRPDLAEILSLTGLDRRLAVYPDAQRALASF